jgi:cytochrome c oxidase subunit 2
MVMTVGVALAVALTGCRGDDSAGELSTLAQQGRELAASQGCAACHGDRGQGTIGPAWTGLAGSAVQLEGGGTVVADSAYLRRSILEPGAEIVAGYTIAMPEVSLTAAEVDAIVAFIEELR